MFNGFDVEKHPFLTMWATNALFLNDSSEYTFGVGICREAFMYYEAEHDIPSDKCLFNGFGYSEVIKKDKLNSMPYVISFCMTENNASMWDMYSMNGNGVAIIIDEEEIVDLDRRVTATPCIYCTNESDLLQRKGLMDEVYNHYAYKMMFTSSDKIDPTVERIGRSWTIVQTMAPRIKHSSYESEHEYRLIRQGIDSPKFRIRKDTIIPYKEVYIPIKSVKGFIIGPTADFDYMRMSLEIYLASIGLSELGSHIQKSSVPYRGNR